MKYRNHTLRSTDGKTGVLLVNLGTPDTPTTGALRRYLREFLWDPRVVEVSRPLWWLILNGIVLNTRPRRSAAAYRTVWGAQGSPLLATSRRLTTALDSHLAGWTTPPLVELAMRYGNPSVPAALEKFDEADVDRILVLPLYPQFSASTTASIFDRVTEVLQRWRRVPELRFINQYHDEQGYIDALANSVRNHQQLNGQPDKLLISFHGIPKRYAKGGDPYPLHCEATANSLAQSLELSDDQWQLSYQSRFGREEWLRPYTDETLKSWGRDGIEHVQVICPGFAVDCLETIEEIGEENRHYFESHGGKRYSYITALNDTSAHVAVLASLIHRHTQGW